MILNTKPAHRMSWKQIIFAGLLAVAVLPLSGYLLEAQVVAQEQSESVQSSPSESGQFRNRLAQVVEREPNKSETASGYSERQEAIRLTLLLKARSKQIERDKARSISQAHPTAVNLLEIVSEASFSNGDFAVYLDFIESELQTLVETLTIFTHSIETLKSLNPESTEAVETRGRMNGAVARVDGQISGLIELVNDLETRVRSELNLLGRREQPMAVSGLEDEKTILGGEAVQKISIMGAVSNPRSIILAPEEKLNLLQAVTAAGGYSAIANKNRISVIRTGEPERVFTEGEITSSISGGEPFYLKDGDTVMIDERRF